MKGRSQRKMIVYGLAIALLVTTVAYAVLQTTLNINGTVNRKGGSWNIHFENVANVVKCGDATITTPTISNAGATLTFSASLAVPKDSVSFTVDVVNDGTIDAMLSQVVLTGQSEAAANDVTYTATYGDGTPINVNDELKQNQTKTIKVTAVYNDVDSVSAEEVELDLGLTLIYVQAEGTGSGSTEVNPPYGPEVGDTSLANAPDLYNNSLTPVVYDETARAWKVANANTAWYNYDNQQWANAVILNSEVTKDVGDTVNIETEVKATYVWIPRYEYRIVGQYGTHTDGTAGTQETPGEIEVNFISATQTTATSGYHIHPAFTFGDTEESGIWVGKFETTGSTTTPTILPNNKNISYMYMRPTVVLFNSSSLFATYLSNSSGVDAHMMNNSEWGAVAYLSQSRYGKYGNSDYTGIYKEVYPNDATQYTGRSYGTVLTTDRFCSIDADWNEPCLCSSEGTYRYDESGATVVTDGESYLDNSGIGASTTGTIYGVYDMSGGTREAVMGLYINEGHAGYAATGSEYLNDDFNFEDGWFDEEENQKYFDAYTSSDFSTACNGGPCYGHALSETENWYGVNFELNSEFPYLTRGGDAYANNEGSLTGFDEYFDEEVGIFAGFGYSVYHAMSMVPRSVLARS